MKKFNALFTRAILVMMLLSSTALFGQGKWVRYNLAGYGPDSPKRAIVLADADCAGQSWEIKDNANTVLLSGTLGVSMTAAGTHTSKAFNHEIDFTSLTAKGEYSLVIDGTLSVPVKITGSQYHPLAHEVLRALRVRRSGSNDALDHGFSHGGDSIAPIVQHDGSVNFTPTNFVATGAHVDLMGGWYDAGDYIKFTHTIAYATYNLLLAYTLSPATFDGVKTHSSTSYDDLLDEAKWGLDFLMKTMPNSSTFIMEVGDEDDHHQGQRMPEDDLLDGQRKAYAVKSKTQMGLTAAALALGSQVFEIHDATLASSYLAKAEEIFDEAELNAINSAYLDAQTNDFYWDKEPEDNMELGATELYLATNSASYLTKAQTYADQAQGGYWSSWANLDLKANFRLAPHHTGASNYFDWEMGYFEGKANAADNVWKIPHDYVWASLYSQFGMANAAMTHMILNNSTTYEPMAAAILDYTFGVNNWGLGFISSESYDGSIETSYAQIYRLQTNLYPIGEIAEGPAPESDHISYRPDFDPPFDPNLIIRGTSDKFQDFNTSSIVYFEHEGDFVCSETTIAGLSEGILMLALANRFYGTTNIAPSVALTAPADGSRHDVGTNVSYEATASDSDGSVKQVEFFANGNSLGMDDTSPYAVVNNTLAIGSYTITAVATDNEGAKTTSAPRTIHIDPVSTQQPYHGYPVAIPGIVQAEEYDFGGQDIAYFDNSPGNEGAAFRNDDVDIEPCTDIGGGYNVGWTYTGEWLEYTVDVTSSGSYTINFRVAAIASGKAVSVSIDGMDVTGNVSVPNTGGWQSWTTVSAAGVPLTAGTHILRINFPTDEINLNYIEVTTGGNPPIADFTASTTTVCQGNTVTFTNASSGNISTYAWDFGAGAVPSTATGPGPHTVTYNVIGTSTATLTVGGPQGSSSKSENIVVEACNDDFIVAFEVRSDWGSGMTAYIHITNNSSVAIDGWNLIFYMDPVVDSYWNCEWNATNPENVVEAGWNSVINPGQTRSFGFTANYSAPLVLPTTGTLNGIPFTFVTAKAAAPSESLAAGSFMLAPNPATDILNLTVPDAEQFQVSIINISGKEVVRDIVAGHEARLDVSHLAKGLYIVRIQSNQEVYQQQLIKQ